MVFFQINSAAFAGRCCNNLFNRKEIINKQHVYGNVQFEADVEASRLLRNPPAVASPDQHLGLLPLERGLEKDAFSGLRIILEMRWQLRSTSLHVAHVVVKVVEVVYRRCRRDLAVKVPRRVSAQTLPSTTERHVWLQQRRRRLYSDGRGLDRLEIATLDPASSSERVGTNDPGGDDIAGLAPFCPPPPPRVAHLCRGIAEK